MIQRECLENENGNLGQTLLFSRKKVLLKAGSPKCTIMCLPSILPPLNTTHSIFDTNKTTDWIDQLN